MVEREQGAQGEEGTEGDLRASCGAPHEGQHGAGAEAAREVATALRLARGIALSGDASIEVRFDPERALCETRERAGTLLSTRWLPPGVGFAALPARSRVLFGGLGSAENATVTLAAGARTRSVIVNQRGRVRVQ